MSIKKVIITLFIVLGIIVIGLCTALEWATTPKKSKMYIDTNQNDHFILYEWIDNFPKEAYTYMLYRNNNGNKSEKREGYFYSETQITKDIFSKYTTYNYENLKVKLYSYPRKDRFIYRTSMDSEYKYRTSEGILMGFQPQGEKSYKKDNYAYLIPCCKEYKCLVPFYRNVLNDLNKDNFYIAAIFLIVMDDTESFKTIVNNIKLIKKEDQKCFLKYIKNYPESKKDKDIIIDKSVVYV